MYVCSVPHPVLSVDVCSSLDEQGCHLRATTGSSCHQRGPSKLSFPDLGVRPPVQEDLDGLEVTYLINSTVECGPSILSETRRQN